MIKPNYPDRKNDRQADGKLNGQTGKTDVYTSVKQTRGIVYRSLEPNGPFSVMSQKLFLFIYLLFFKFKIFLWLYAIYKKISNSLLLCQIFRYRRLRPCFGTVSNQRDNEDRNVMRKLIIPNTEN